MPYQTPLFPSDRPATTTDSVYQWHPSAGATKIMPSGSKQIAGWLISERPPSQYFNAIWGANAEWITFLDTLIADFSQGPTGRVAIGDQSTKDAVASALPSSTMVGNLSGADVTGTVGSSTLIGSEAGRSSDGDSIVAVGASAGKSGASKSVNIGVAAGQGSVGALGLVSIGFNTGVASTSLINGVIVGYQAGQTITGSAANAIMIGASSGNLAQGNDLIAMGFEAGNNSNGDGTIMIGKTSGKDSVSAGSVLIGFESGQTITQAQAVAVGYQAGKTADSIGITALGYLAGTALLSSNAYLVAVGHSAGNAPTFCDSAVMIGRDSGEAMSSGPGSVSIGLKAAFQATNTNTSLISIGQNSGFQIIDGAYGTLIGYQAGYSSEGNENVYIGREAGFNGGDTITGGISRNVSIGFQAGYTGRAIRTISIGSTSGKENTGSNSIFIGENSGNQVAISAPADMTGSIIAIGEDALFLQGFNDTIHTKSVFIGYQSGRDNQVSNAMKPTWDTALSGYSQLRLSCAAPSYSILDSLLANQSDWLWGFFDPGAATNSIVGTDAMLKIGRSNTGTRAAFDVIWTGIDEAIGAMSLDADGVRLFCYTAAGWKSTTLA